MDTLEDYKISQLRAKREWHIQNANELMAEFEKREETVKKLMLNLQQIALIDTTIKGLQAPA